MLRVDVADFDGHGFGDAQAGAIDSRASARPVLQTSDVFQEPADFLRTEHDRELVGAAHPGKALLAPGHFQGDQEEELHGGNETVDAFRRQLLLVQEIEFVLENGLQVQVFRAGVVEFCEIGDVMELTSLCGGREATQLHVFDKPLSERCHWSSFRLDLWLREYHFQFAREGSRQPPLCGAKLRPLARYTRSVLFTDLAPCVLSPTIM